MKFSIQITRFFVMLLIAFLVLPSCNKDDGHNPLPTPGDNPSLGWNINNDNIDSIPNDIPMVFGSQNFPSQYDLTDKFPPVGDQGDYGTCLAWAAGYYAKTAVNAIQNEWTAADLSNPANQTSSLDLFLAIPPAFRMPGCAGTFFQPALEVLSNRGVTNKQEAPYVNLGSCTQSPQASWTQNAASNKIAYYRQIQPDIGIIKRNIVDNNPVVFGARLGDNFVTWRSEEVISGHTTFNNLGIHAGHAMVIVGYDDSKGPSGAFRVINSWGEVWGDNGFIWIDYNFMVNSNFGSAFLVLYNEEPQIDPENHQGGSLVDLIPWDLYDAIDFNSGDFTNRYLVHDIYNIGQQTASASTGWDYVYAYVNPFDAEDWGVILHNEITNQYGAPGEIGDHPNGWSDQSIWTNVDIQPNSSLGTVLFDDLILWPYKMPAITGYYYLVLVADPERRLDESNRQNNFFWIGDENGLPVYFENGIQYGLSPNSEDRIAAPQHLRTTIKTEFNSDIREMNSKNSNGYSNAEIERLIKGSIDFNLLSRHISEGVAKKIKGIAIAETK